MDVKPLEVEVRWRDKVAVLELRGEIDGFSEAALGAAYAETGNAGTVVLDFARVAYINSSGIALIVGLLAKARASHRPVLACSLSPHYAEIFEITRLSDFMGIFPDEESAVGEAVSKRSTGEKQTEKTGREKEETRRP